MREIKFRGKSLHNQEWVYGDLCTISGGPKIVVDPLTENYVSPKTIGQYIGMKDKNGTEIYEGDICNAVEGEGFLVEYGNYGEPLLVNTEEAYCPHEMDEKHLEVVGNVHDNPELLK